ncbi:MAG: winged helix-turn-helix transcriptional regulator [Anaerolineaceae bacterium]|nr:winged helix-turn-helix transcriptional regulator [Anaerolineaceae bacterium]
MQDSVNLKFQQLILRFHQLGGELPPLERFDITPAQVVYLDFLAKHPDCRLSQLTDALQYSSASVSAMVSTLSTKGLVRKTQEPFDGRAVSLSLTEKGRRVVFEIEEFRNQRVEMILKGLDEEEKRTLLGLIIKAISKKEEG